MRVASCRRRAVTFRRLREDLDDSLGPPTPCLALGEGEALRAVTIKIRSDAIPDITVIDDFPDLQLPLTFR